MLARYKTELRHIEQRIAQRQQPQLVYADPLSFARHRLHFTPDAWQETVLTSEGKRMLLLCCRQSGKSTVVAALALHQALSRAGSLILLVSRSLRQSGELFRKVKDFVNVLSIRPKLEEDNLLSARFVNGSRVVSLPGDEQTVRGFSGARLIVIDEAARVPDSLYYSLRPMLAVSNGRLIALSTPWGQRGFFHHEWTEGAGWERVKVVGSQCPRISAAFLAEEKATLPDAWYKSEYACEFVQTTDSVFAYQHVMGALSDEVQPLFPVSPTYSHGAIDHTVLPLMGVR